VRDVFNEYQHHAAHFGYPRKQNYWQTEGNYDFLGILSAQRRARWRWQFMTRAFAAGIRKVCVMDASPAEQVAVREYVAALPDPFPMKAADGESHLLAGAARVFRHQDRSAPKGDSGDVWVLWAVPGSRGAIVELPVAQKSVLLVGGDGRHTTVAANNHRIQVHLAEDSKIAAPIIVIDRPPSSRTTTASGRR